VHKCKHECKTLPSSACQWIANQHSCSAERSIDRMQRLKGRCMELGNWPILVQLGSTNSKGLPVLFQGSHQVFFLNNHQLLCSLRQQPWACPWSPCVPVKRSGSWLQRHRPTQGSKLHLPAVRSKLAAVPIGSPLPHQEPLKELSSCPTSKPS